MNKSILFCFFIICNSANASQLEEFYYSLPILYCYDKNYRSCVGDLTIETCTVKLKQHRDTCANGIEVVTDKLVSKSMICMLQKHLDIPAFNDVEVKKIEAKCGGFNVSFTKAKEELMKKDPEWIKELLK